MSENGGEKTEGIGVAVREEHRELARIMQPKSMEEAIALAERLSKSDSVPAQYKGKPDDILIAMALGSELGIHWTQALASIWITNGKPTIYGDMGLALVEASGLLEYINEWDESGLDGGTAFCQVKRKGKPEPITRSFSMAQAEKVVFKGKRADGSTYTYKLTDKENWRNYDWRMRQFRARWLALRDQFADVLKGVIGREEVEEIDVTPPPEQVKALPTVQTAAEAPQAENADVGARITEIEKWITEAPDEEIRKGADSLFAKMDGLPEETVSALVEKFTARKAAVGVLLPQPEPDEGV